MISIYKLAIKLLVELPFGRSEESVSREIYEKYLPKLESLHHSIIPLMQSSALQKSV